MREESISIDPLEDLWHGLLYPLFSDTYANWYHHKANKQTFPLSLSYIRDPMLIRERVFICIFRTDKKALRHKFSSFFCLLSEKAHVKVY